MNKTTLVVIITTMVPCILIVGNLLLNKDKYTQNYKGICLFDIDGTLTTCKENEQVVQYCIDKGYAVGIATAGSIYNQSNISSFNWMPKNLYEFMKKNNFDTFNNVASGILAGRYNYAEYTKTLDNKPYNIFWPGWLKGVALENAGRIYKIKNPKKLILFDNDPNFINGVRHYNKNLNVICAGMPCNGVLTLDVVKKILK
jgi:hydroxymethylpyrimidine pyrophosphatase-like HAD family hydrolase